MSLQCISQLCSGKQVSLVSKSISNSHSLQAKTTRFLFTPYQYVMTSYGFSFVWSFSLSIDHDRRIVHSHGLPVYESLIEWRCLLCIDIDHKSNLIPGVLTVCVSSGF